MLIEALAKLAHGCGAEGISLEIPPSDGGNVKVLVVTELRKKPLNLFMGR